MAEYTIWGGSSETPATPDFHDGTSVNLGVRFGVTTAGNVKGIRFWQGATATGNVSVSLWDPIDGSSLAASATVATTAANGWVQIDFASPVAIEANKAYTASFFTSSGSYAFTSNYFASAGKDSGPLHLLKDGDGDWSFYRNGVFAYAGAPTPPSGTFNAGNYWIDVVFDDGVTDDRTGEAANTLGDVQSASAGAAGVAGSGAATLSAFSQTAAAGVAVKARAGIGELAHRYWRLYITAINNATSQGGVAEFALYSWGVRQAGTYTASSEGTGNEAVKAGDGNTSTAWMNSSGQDISTTPAWLKVDLGSAASIDSIGITGHPTLSGRSPKDFKVQWSDNGTDWTDAVSQTGVSWSAGQARTYTLPAPAAESFASAATATAATHAGAANALDAFTQQAAASAQEQPAIVAGAASVLDAFGADAAAAVAIGALAAATLDGFAAPAAGAAPVTAAMAALMGAFASATGATALPRLRVRPVRGVMHGLVTGEYIAPPLPPQREPLLFIPRERRLVELPCD
jgi:hypothetical protein